MAPPSVDFNSSESEAVLPCDLMSTSTEVEDGAKSKTSQV